MATPQTALLALEAAKRANKAVRGDLAVISYQKPPKTRGKGKKKVTMPGREVEIHVSPAAVGLGIVTIGGGLTIGWVWWNGIKIPTLLGSIEIIPGAKDSVKGVYAKNKAALVDWYSKKTEKTATTPLEAPMPQGKAANPYDRATQPWYWGLWESTH
jgi:hypothetical protein